ncbi:hypothetical protein [Dictyobacter formicarum]|uniref:Uncharacterized protein n=1 Tax=Dictyobacter formicarum TaxID=2778368 RepID=A0ABQ3V9V8_9CHLR|nr:hypothetical protein [Dictyobacter formicarum]GHO82203.1 hypothetical protein KSZ_02090 [Dictyobacter formicarum]
MLAYVFWHWPVPDIEAPTYQHDLITYHQTLAAHRPSGFHHTRVLQMKQASWLKRNEVTYEDWHLVENSAALDPLNERAVSGPCQEPHRQIARWTQGSAGGLYHLVFGDPDLSVVRFAYRFHKPAGMTYGALYEVLQPLLQEVKGMLWTRQMNLGPGPEFCFQSSEPFVFPDILPSLSIPVKQICFTIDR